MNVPIGRLFEEEVRRVAEAVWGLQAGECQPEWYQGDSILRELDGIVRLRDISHALMATTSRKLEKAKSDIAKLNAAAIKEVRKTNLPVEKWLITEHQLEAEHLEHARKNGVKVLTLSQFRNRFFDGRAYIAKRKQGAFGSARNLRDGSISIPENEYVQLPMFAADGSSAGKKSAQERPVDLGWVEEELDKGATIVVIGPFGAGKSLTAREVFNRLAAKYLRDINKHVPAAINLREHWGAVYGDEILERHARSIGFEPKENLTIAWRAGIATLILDGFDELAAQAIAKPSEKNFMRQARYQALQAVRDLVAKVPQGSGVLLCGRDHYFDDLPELSHSLGLHRAHYLVRLGEFTEEQASEFLKRRSMVTALPDWLPRKPLILGYLAHQGLLAEVLRIDASRGFGYAWDAFLDLVCAREAQHERAAMDPRTIRRVLERLACIVRGTSSGTGPLTGVDLADAYKAETGDVAGEGVLMQLQRLPGLTPREQDPTARSFVDPDMLSALQGGAVARALVENSTSIADRRWLNGLSSDGVRMSAHIVRTGGYDASTVLAIGKRFAERRRSEEQQLAGDCLSTAMELARDEGTVDCGGLSLREVHLNLIDLDELTVSNLVLHDSAVNTLNIGPGLLRSSVLFEDCLIQDINGVQSEKALPDEWFRKCTFGSFDDASTNAAVLRLPLPESMKALMTVLRKLYLQAGGGRQIAALRRGLPGGRISDLVEPVLDVLQAEGMVAVSSGIAHPVRRHTARVHAILAAGVVSADPVVGRVRQLG